MRTIKGIKESEKNDDQEYLSAFKKINKLLKKHSIINEVETINNERFILRNLKNQNDGL